VTTVDYPTMDDAVYFCERAGLYIRDPGALASAIARPAAVVWGSEAYDGIHRKGAALLDGIRRSHP
jgi:death-on-curing protein